MKNSWMKPYFYLLMVLNGQRLLRTANSRGIKSINSTITVHFDSLKFLNVVIQVFRTPSCILHLFSVCISDFALL